MMRPGRATLLLLSSTLFLILAAVVAGLDSDNDGHTNAAEIAAFRDPGDAASRPGLPPAPTLSLGWDEIRKLPVHGQFVLMNATKEPTDDYVAFRGVRIIDLLSAAGIYQTGVTGITVFAPDGTSVDCAVGDVQAPFPRGYFFEGPRSFEGSERAFVKYPDELPAGLKDRIRIPGDPWLILAYESLARVKNTSFIYPIIMVTSGMYFSTNVLILSGTFEVPIPSKSRSCQEDAYACTGSRIS